MKTRNAVIAALLAIAVGAWLVAAWPEIERGEICEKNEYTQQKECTQYKALSFILIKITKTLDHHEGTVVGLGTLFVALFTWRLWVSTNRLWKEAEKASGIAETAANAAKDSADAASKAFIATHRPKIIVRRIALSEDNEIFYSATNTGSNDAKITAITARLWMPAPNESLPAIPPYANILPHDRTLKGGESQNFRLVVDPAILERHGFNVGFFQVSKGRPNTDPNATEPALLFLGYIVYEDPLGQRRETGFLRRYDYETGRFNPIDHPEYEYQD